MDSGGVVGLAVYRTARDAVLARGRRIIANPGRPGGRLSRCAGCNPGPGAGDRCDDQRPASVSFRASEALGRYRLIVASGSTDRKSVVEYCASNDPPGWTARCPSTRCSIWHRSKCGNSSLHTRAGLSRGTQCSGSDCPATQGRASARGLGRVHTNGTKKAPFSDRISP